MNRSGLSVLLAGAVVVAASVLPFQAAAGHWLDESEYSTADIVRGVAFAQGPVARTLELEVSRPAGLTQQEIAQAEQVEQQLFDSMMSGDSAQLEAAAEKIVSGDPYAVERGMKSVGAALTRAIDREFPGVTSSSMDVSRCGLVAVCAALSVAAIALGAAIAAVVFNVAGSVNMIYNQNGLWNENGVFNGKDAPHTAAETESASAYTTLSAAELVRHVTVTLKPAG